MMNPTPAAPAQNSAIIRFNRNEFAGAFGDVGTDLPLIVGVALAAKLDGASVLIMFGVMQVLTGLRYRMPMPVQPLKAMAAIVIAQNVSGPVLYGGGLAIGVVMLVLSVTGLIDHLARLVPKCVIRGIQFGLGMQLASLAVKDYVQAEGAIGYVLAALAFALTVFLIGNKKYPAALFVIALGLLYTFFFKLNVAALAENFGIGAPVFYLPQWSDILSGFILLALPQIPLSLGNSVLATRQIAEDLFPERKLTVRQISFTYAIMNLINPFLGGIPTCHGSGGMAGHYAFGGRTGGSVVIYGGFFLLLGIFFGKGFDEIIGVFPLPILGVVLMFEGLALMLLLRDLMPSRSELSIAVLVGLLALGLPYGYLIGVIVGVMLEYLVRKNKISFGNR